MDVRGRCLRPILRHPHPCAYAHSIADPHAHTDSHLHAQRDADANDDIYTDYHAQRHALHDTLSNLYHNADAKFHFYSYLGLRERDPRG